MRGCVRGGVIVMLFLRSRNRGSDVCGRDSCGSGDSSKFHRLVV